MRDWTQQKDTKLPTYPRKGSSHHVVQKFSFFDDFFFLMRDWTQQKDTKLPTYPRKGSSHHVVQKFFFFFFFVYLYIFFLITFFFLCIFAKRRAQCVIGGITTDRTRDGLKGDMGVQPLRHTSNWWHRVGLIYPYWYAFKGNGKTSCTLAAL